MKGVFCGRKDKRTDGKDERTNREDEWVTVKLMNEQMQKTNGWRKEECMIDGGRKGGEMDDLCFGTNEDNGCGDREERQRLSS